MDSVKVPISVRVLPQVAEKVWFTPPRPSDRARAKDARALESVEPISVTVQGRTRPGFVTGEGPLMILVHGWGGRAAQMLDLALAAARNGYRAVAIDSPGHNTDGQRTSDGFQMAAGLESVEASFGPPAGVIAHSLGAMATVMAFVNRPPDTAIWLAPVLDVRDSLQVFSHRAKLAPWTARSLHLRVERFIGEWWPALTAGAQTDLPGSRILLVHDPADPRRRFRSVGGSGGPAPEHAPHRSSGSWPQPSAAGSQRYRQCRALPGRGPGRRQSAGPLTDTFTSPNR